MQLVNMIANALVSTPGGSVHVSPYNALGVVTVQQIDCTALTLVLGAPYPGAPAQVTIGFPGSPFTVSGYLNARALGALMNQIPVFTSGTLPAASSVPAGYQVFNSTTQRVLTSNGTAWVGALNLVVGANASQLGPGNVETLASPSIQRTGSGKICVVGAVSGAVSPQATVTANLYRDGTSGQLLATASITPGGASGPSEFACALSFVDTLPDASGHSYTIQVVGSGGANVTVAAAGASIQAWEL